MREIAQHVFFILRLLFNYVRVFIKVVCGIWDWLMEGKMVVD